MSAGFMFAGVMHFVKPAPFIAIYPDGWPFPVEAIMVSGIAEIMGAVGLLVPWAKLRYAAAIGLILLLVAVYPANINMALHADRFPQFPVWTVYLRLPVQFLLIWVVWKLRK